MAISIRYLQQYVVGAGVTSRPESTALLPLCSSKLQAAVTCLVATGYTSIRNCHIRKAVSSKPRIVDFTDIISWRCKRQNGLGNMGVAGVKSASRSDLLVSASDLVKSRKSGDN